MKKVGIYTTPSCVYCRKAKDMFQKHNIPYSEYNVMTDVTKRDEMIKRTGQMGVPVPFTLVTASCLVHAEQLVISVREFGAEKCQPRPSSVLEVGRAHV